MFLGFVRDFRVFCQKKLCFRLFVLNSIEGKDSKFISGEEVYLMVPVSSPFSIQI